MTPAEVRQLLLFIDTISTVVRFAKDKIDEANRQGLITVEEQNDRMSKIDAILKAVEEPEGGDDADT